MQTGDELLVLLLMTCPGILKAFFLQYQQCFVQCVKCIDWGGVVIGALRTVAPISHDEFQIQEPALLATAGTDGVDCARAEGYGRYAGRAGQALLGT